MIVTANRTCVLLAGEDMITQKIDTHLAGAKRATVSVGKHLGDGRSKTPAEKSLPHVRRRYKNSIPDGFPAVGITEKIIAIPAKRLGFA